MTQMSIIRNVAQAAKANLEPLAKLAENLEISAPKQPWHIDRIYNL